LPLFGRWLEAMDASPTPYTRETLTLEISRSSDGRLDGNVRAEAAEPWRPFSGTLELLKVLEEILDATEQGANRSRQ
jgi:hypothetical protein